MGDLIDSLLALAKVSRIDLQWEPVDLSAMAASIVAALREHGPAREAEITIQPGVLAHGDPRLLRQVLENLLGNAWKFSGNAQLTRISFSTRLDPAGRAVHEVRDNGAGFDMKYAERLFGAFQRLHTESEFAGSGIGLATVQRIVRRHEGQVWAHSSPGNGTVLSFTLGNPSPG